MSKDKKKKKAGKAGQALKALANNPMLADVVAAALVATASALRDTKKARQLASETGDDLRKLAKSEGNDGNALWEMALQIGRRSLESLTSDAKKSAKPKAGAVKPASKKSSKKPATKKSTSKTTARPLAK